MKFSSIADKFFSLCSFDNEILTKDNRRPYLLIARLKYSGVKQDFAIPFRSNISNYIPKYQYFSLPPRPKTKHNKIHGLHFIKMFPIMNQYLEKFNTDNDPYYELITRIIDKNEKTIISQAQSYLHMYQNGERVPYSTDIHGIYLTLHGLVDVPEVAPTSEKALERNKE